MAKRRFEIKLEGYVEIELDDKVIDVVDDEWRKSLYPLYTPKDIAEHVGYNLIVNKWKLSSLDGWADQPDENARVVCTHEWLLDATEVVLEEGE